jgi:hypothetical protein
MRARVNVKMKNLIRIFFISLLLTSFAHAENTTAAQYVCESISNKSEKELCISKANQLLNDSNRNITNRVAIKNPSGFFSFIWPWLWWIFYYGLGVIIGFHIYRDAKSREWLFLRIRPIFWLVLGVFKPVLTLLAYWLMHYSRFAMSYSDAMPPKEKTQNDE